VRDEFVSLCPSDRENDDVVDAPRSRCVDEGVQVVLDVCDRRGAQREQLRDAFERGWPSFSREKIHRDRLHAVAE